MLAYLEEQRQGLNQHKQQLEVVLLLRAELLAREQGAEDRLHLRKILLQREEQDSRDLSHITDRIEQLNDTWATLRATSSNNPASAQDAVPAARPPSKGGSPILLSHAPQRGLRAADFTTAGASTTGPGSLGSPPWPAAPVAPGCSHEASPMGEGGPGRARLPTPRRPALKGTP